LHAERGNQGFLPIKDVALSAVTPWAIGRKPLNSVSISSISITEVRANAIKDIKSSVDYLVTNVPVVEAEQVVNNPVAASGGLSTWLWNRTSRFMVLHSRREEELLTNKL
jgi:hypothetical protein